MSSELMRRIAFTLGALLVYWLGLHIPLPGVDATAWTALFDMQSGGMLGRANALSGGGLRTLSILSLAVTPYVSAAIVLQLMAIVSRGLRVLLMDEPFGSADPAGHLRMMQALARWLNPQLSRKSEPGSSRRS